MADAYELPAIRRRGPPVEPRGLALGGIRGIDASLRDLLEAYKPLGDQGVVSACVLAVEVPDIWAWASWVEQGQSPSITAGSGVQVTLFTTPSDQRWWLDGFNMNRDSGDNTISALAFIAPEGYGSGTRQAELIVLTTAATNIYWPAGNQTVNRALGPAPILMEPGTQVAVVPGGAGVAGTVLNFNICIRRSKMARTLQPEF